MRKDSDGFNDAQIEEIWEMFTDVPIDESERLEAEWFGFPAGTSKYDIWQWFDKHYSKGIYELVY